MRQLQVFAVGRFRGHRSTLPSVLRRPGAVQRRQGGPAAEGAEADESQVRSAGERRPPLPQTMLLLSVRPVTLYSFPSAQNNEYEDGKTLKNSKYKDRAESRRQTVGSEGVFQRDDAPASVHQ